MYDYQFSKGVVKQFLKNHPRAWGSFLTIYPKCDETRIIYLFRAKQQQWNFFKRMVQHLEKHFPKGKHSEIRDLLGRYYLTNVNQYKKNPERIVEISEFYEKIT